MKKVLLIFLFVITPLFANAQMSNFDCFKKVYEQIPALWSIDTQIQNDTYGKNYLSFKVIYEPSFFNSVKKVYFEIKPHSGNLQLTNPDLRFWTVNPNTGEVYSWDPQEETILKFDSWKKQHSDLLY